MLRAASFRKFVIGAEQLVSYLARNLGEKLSCSFLLTIAVVTHQIPHNITDIRRIRQGRVTELIESVSYDKVRQC